MLSSTTSITHPIHDSSINTNTNANTEGNNETKREPQRESQRKTQREEARRKALEEAMAAMTTEEYTNSSLLQDFNLLSVVTTPRTLSTFDSHSLHAHTNTHTHTGTSATSTVPSTPSTISNSTSANTMSINTSTNNNNTINNSNNSETSLLSNLLLESPHFLSQVSSTISKEIDLLNNTLYSYSKNYLGTDYFLSSSSSSSNYPPNLDLEVEMAYAAQQLQLQNYQQIHSSDHGSGAGIIVKSHLRHFPTFPGDLYLSSSTNTNTNITTSSANNGNTIITNNNNITNTHTPSSSNLDESNSNYITDLLSSLDMTSVEAFLRKSGAYAIRFQEREGESKQSSSSSPQTVETTTNTTNTNLSIEDTSHNSMVPISKTDVNRITVRLEDNGSDTGAENTQNGLDYKLHSNSNKQHEPNHTDYTHHEHYDNHYDDTSNQDENDVTFEQYSNTNRTNINTTTTDSSARIQHSQSNEISSLLSSSPSSFDPTESVPEIFFSPYFDLTNPKTFESLLVWNDDNGDNNNYNQYKYDSEYNSIHTNNNNTITKNDSKTTIKSNISTPPTTIQPPIKLQQPEQFTQYLDTIEIALLHQVKSKSNSFFRETNRFSYLKSLVSESVLSVQTLRHDLEKIREESITHVELIPIMDGRRRDMMLLESVLELIEEMVRVKSSVSGLIAQGDHLGAIEAIYRARLLLNGYHDNTNNNGGGGGSKEKDKKFPLGKLNALSKVNDQLEQYENLVVMDLSNQLVEIFLNWGMSYTASSSQTSVLDNTSYYNQNNHFSSSSSNFLSPSEVRSKVKNIILTLQKCNQLPALSSLYREKLCNTIRVTVRTIVSECASDAFKTAKLSVGAAPNANATIQSRNNSSATTVTTTDADGNLNTMDAQNTNAATLNNIPKSSITEGLTSMSYEQFMDCLDMIFEQILTLLHSAAGVNKFCLEEGISLKEVDPSSGNVAANDSITNTVSPSTNASPSILFAASELSHKSASELLRVRKEAHSLLSFEDMKRLWDSCLGFSLQVEALSGQKAYGLKSTLLSQAKAFVEHRHEANMANMVAALDGERWTQCNVSTERQASLDRLCYGRAVLSSTSAQYTTISEASESKPDAIIDGKRYKVVWSSLLLVEMIMGNVACAAHFQTLATAIVGKVSELLRLFNSRATQLVLGAGAIHSSARLKSINAKHLALVTQCIGMILKIFPHIRATLMAQLPNKQHTLLLELDAIKKEYEEHNEKILNKFVSIIGGIVDHVLLPKIGNLDFDQRSNLKTPVEDANGGINNDRIKIVCCPFLEGVVTNTRKMHQVLITLLPVEDLMDVFSRIFAHVDSKVSKSFIAADSDDKNTFSFPTSPEGKLRLIMEVKVMSEALNSLPSTRPWEFASILILRKRLDVPSDNVTEAQDVSVDNSQYILNDANQDCDDQVVESNQEEEELSSTKDIVDSKFESGERLDLIETEPTSGNTNIENTNDNDERTEETATVQSNGLGVETES